MQASYALVVTLSAQIYAVFNLALYEKAAKLADLEVSHRAPWAKSRKSAHSIFYNYKSSLLKKLQIETADKVFVLESYDPSTGLISGAIWTKADSLSYTVNGSKLEYKTSFPISQHTKQVLVNWDTLGCPDLQIKNGYVHPQHFVVQEYNADKSYKVCVIIL